MERYNCIVQSINITDLRLNGVKNIISYDIYFETKTKFKNIEVDVQTFKKLGNFFCKFDESELKKDKIYMCFSDFYEEYDEILNIRIKEDLDKNITLNFKKEVRDILVYNMKFNITYEDFCNLIKDIEFIFKKYYSEKNLEVSNINKNVICFSDIK